MRKFYLEADNGLRYDFQNPKKCILESPTGLGFSKTNTYEKVGETFLKNSSDSNQKNITGILHFTGDYYKNFQEFANFIKTYADYKLIYEINNTEYFIDVDIQELTKSDSQRANMLSCNISFLTKTLFYKKIKNNYFLSTPEDCSKWNVKFDFFMIDDIPAIIDVKNKGHTDSSFDFELIGPLVNPTLKFIKDNKVINSIEFKVNLGSEEKLLYSNRDNNLYVIKINSNGIEEKALDCLDLKNDNFMKIPKGMTKLSFTAENTSVSKLTLNVYEEYEIV